MRWVTEIFIVVVVLSVTTEARRRNRHSVQMVTKTAQGNSITKSGSITQSGSMTQGGSITQGGSMIRGESLTQGGSIIKGESLTQGGSIIGGGSLTQGGGSIFDRGQDIRDGSSIFFNRTIITDEGEDIFRRPLSLWNSTSSVRCYTGGITGINIEAISQVLETVSVSVVQIMKFLSSLQFPGGMQNQDQMSQYYSKLTEMDYKLDQILAAPGSQSVVTQSIQQLTERVDYAVQKMDEIHEMEKMSLTILVDIQSRGGGGRGNGGGGGGGGNGGNDGQRNCMTRELSDIQAMLQGITEIIQSSNREQSMLIRQVSSDVTNVVESVRQITTTATGYSPPQDNSLLEQIISQAFMKFQRSISSSLERITSLQQSMETIISSASNFGSMTRQYEAMVAQLNNIQSIAESILAGILNLSQKRCSVTVDGKYSREIRGEIQKFRGSTQGGSTMSGEGKGLWFTKEKSGK